MVAGLCISALASGCAAPKRVYKPGQDPSGLNDLAFVHYLAQVPVVTVDEGTRAVLMITGPTGRWPTYQQRVAELKRLGAIKDAWRLEPDQILTKGTLAYTIRTICELPGSLNESLSAVTGLGERRYALQTCVAERVLPFGRPGDPVTGGEILSAVTEAERYLAARKARKP